MTNLEQRNSATQKNKVDVIGRTFGGLSHPLKGIETNGFKHRVQRQIL